MLSTEQIDEVKALVKDITNDYTISTRSNQIRIDVPIEHGDKIVPAILVRYPHFVVVSNWNNGLIATIKFAV